MILLFINDKKYFEFFPYISSNVLESFLARNYYTLSYTADRETRESNPLHNVERYVTLQAAGETITVFLLFPLLYPAHAENTIDLVKLTVQWEMEMVVFFCI